MTGVLHDPRLAPSHGSARGGRSGCPHDEVADLPVVRVDPRWPARVAKRPSRSERLVVRSARALRSWYFDDSAPVTRSQDGSSTTRRCRGEPARRSSRSDSIAVPSLLQSAHRASPGADDDESASSSTACFATACRPPRIYTHHCSRRPRRVGQPLASPPRPSRGTGASRGS